MNPSSATRRRFLKSAVGVGAAAWTARSWAQTEGSNSDIRAAVIGFGGRGGSHINAFSKMKGVRLVALCDADEKVLASGVARMKGKGHPDIKGFTDMRNLFEQKDIDVISIATPNHWHALASIWAIQSGKDVYVEKPVSHNVWEGRQVVKAAEAHGKIVQTGTQCRSSREGIAQAVAWVQEGNLGKILISRGLCYKRRKSIGKVLGAQPLPANINYDLWCGPADMEPLMRKRLHYDWHWVSSTGNGDLGNQGIHQMDICRWFLGETTLAPQVLSVGGRLGYVDDGDTANTQISFQGYEKAPLIFEVRGLETEKYKGAGVGCIIHCEGGDVIVPNYTSAYAIDKEGNEIAKWKGAVDHFENFIQAVRSRKVADLHSDILEGHLSSALCHTGNISYRLGQLSSPDAVRESLADYKGMEETVGRMMEHLVQNGVDPEKDLVTLGQPLQMDPATEVFHDNEVANALATRNYREPYLVPEIV